MSSEAHENAVRILAMKYGVSTTGFRQAIKRAFPDDDIRCPNVIPDAYLITDDQIAAWEVELSSPLAAEKIEQYALLWAEIDATGEDTDFRLYSVDRHACEHEIDLQPFYYLLMTRKGRDHR